MSCFLLIITDLFSQKLKLDEKGLEPVNVSISTEKLKGRKAVKAVKDTAVKAFDEATFIKVSGTDFKDGIIEVKVLSRLLEDAPEFARGFMGVAFRINEENSKFECIYLRPTNARVDNQVRRNHSIQYYSYPDFKFERLRKESPEEYESYTDMGLNKWITMKIVVKGKQAKLFINDNKQPSLIVNDLKHGENATGAIGLWVDIGTERFFTNLKLYTD
ncbi:hypothetical protein FVR03_16340 [Pontibacter qinzhouensis]|uniref:DUF1080 domain-containing protein n=1 Tax=Pontibacter qinzhouensis TaxID=2603253 RepID=A0A5C8JK36_9BACT|nr:hypothetical protein [Pontibacter qinzhouensis]TXK36947.1 hypothetical protein FVR03_16340 [Pontibacter qinzhouensis]